MKVTAPVVSILLPTYNGALYLPDQISSIASQSRRGFEVIAVDDGSGDHSRQLLVDWALRDSRVRLLPSSKNEGQNFRLQQAFMASASPNIAIADQDDVWHEYKIELLLDAILDREAVYGSSLLIDKDGDQLGVTLLETLDRDLRLATCPLALLFSPMVSGHAMMIRRDSFVPAAFRHRRELYDYWLALGAAFSDRGLGYVSEAKTYHRIHATNANNSSFATKRGISGPRRVLEALKSVTQRRYDFLNRCEFLASHEQLSPRIRLSLSGCFDACFAGWFSPARRTLGGHASLRQKILGTLAPMAASERGREAFRLNVEELLSGPPSLLAFRYAGARLIQNSRG